mgnify:CR=1 FL=1|jgi:hypothetical protein|tara:strand:+ start:32606 stop:33532 length:927 start_codon:yes stop_codon:yes gene_type:complete
MTDFFTRRDFISFGAGIGATIGGALAMGKWQSRDVPVIRAENNKAQLFLHIPKTGGTSLREHIMDNVKAHQIIMPERPENIWHLKKYYSHYLNAQDYIYVRGHFANDWRRFLNDYTDQTQCITMLRNPVSRFRSSYQYQIEHWAVDGSYAKEILAQSPHSLSDVIDIFDRDAADKNFKHRAFVYEYNDGMTRRLSGEGWNAPYRGTTPAMLQNAKDNLRTRFKIIGVTEEYNKFLYLLKQNYGWDLNPSIRKNAAKKKMAVTDQDRDKINDLNRLDVELHKYAHSLSAEMFAALGDNAPQDYRDFIKG